MYGRRYAEAFRLAEQCVTDSELTPEEAQLWNLLSLSTDHTVT